MEVQMKLISFNVNGIRARLHQIEELINTHQPDVIGLQEIKVHNEEFPLEAIEKLGYHAYFHGQKAHYGVAFLTKHPLESVQMGFPTDDEDAQKRMIIGTIKSSSGKLITVLNGYFPQGENREHPWKFPYKKGFYEDLQNYLNNHHSADEKLVVMGDFNISPTDDDIGIGEPNRKRWLREGKCSFLPEEREWYERLLGWGLEDTYRQIHPEVTDRFSWFDYRSRGFDRDPKRGLRIDTVLATQPLMATLRDADIDYEIRAMEKPSDHCPVWATFDV